jgi:hypothetical protein
MPMPKAPRVGRDFVADDRAIVGAVQGRPGVARVGPAHRSVPASCAMDRIVGLRLKRFVLCVSGVGEHPLSAQSPRTLRASGGTPSLGKRWLKH